MVERKKCIQSFDGNIPQYSRSLERVGYMVGKCKNVSSRNRMVIVDWILRGLFTARSGLL
jgi:hypothetical protein